MAGSTSSTTWAASPWTKRVFFMESFLNMAIFGPLLYALPGPMLIAMLPTAEVDGGAATAEVTPLAIELMRWSAAMFISISGFGFFSALRSGSDIAEQIFQEAHLLGDVLYVGAVIAWVWRTSYWTPSNIFNIVYGVFLFIVRIKRVGELRASASSPQTQKTD